jgi:hypothetical protein
MAKIKSWCTCNSESVKSHALHGFVADPAKLPAAVVAVAKVLPGHYASETRIAQLLADLGKPAAAKYVKDKLPTSPTLRSGELGEILAASYVDDYSDYSAPVRKLRWKDHRNMAMRGDDILGVRTDAAQEIKFLKGEAKSRKSLDAATINEAAAALKATRNRPTPHALAFLADRLNELGETALSDLILKHQLKLGIKLKQVTHFMFMFSGNDPIPLLKASLTAYKGKVRQHVVGLHVPDHQKFIKRVYRRAASAELITNG